MSVENIDSGDIFVGGAEAIVNPVNCVGVMGKGLALEFRNRFPDNYRSYKLACEMRELHPGGLHAFDQNTILVKKTQPTDARWIVNLATKDHWRDPSRIEWIESGAQMLARWATDHQVKSVACPALGAGLGGLPWDAVKSIVEKAFEKSDTRLMLYAPAGVSPKFTNRSHQP